MAIVRISKGQEKGSVNVEQLFFDTYPFDPELRLVQALLRSRCRKQILQLCSGPTTSQQICKANFNIGKAFGEAVNLALKAASMSKDQLDLVGEFRLNHWGHVLTLVASHGQTIWHEVVGKEVHSTLQIGESAVISEITGNSLFLRSTPNLMQELRACQIFVLQMWQQVDKALRLLPYLITPS